MGGAFGTAGVPSEMTVTTGRLGACPGRIRMARFVPALGLAALAAVASAARAEDAPAWVMDPAESRLEIAYPGSPVSGGGPFERFDAEIRFDTDRPEATRLRVVVETGSLRLRDREARRSRPGRNGSIPPASPRRCSRPRAHGRPGKAGPATAL